MSDPTELLDKIWKSVAGQSDAHSKLLQRVSFLSTIILPIGIGLISGFKTEWFSQNEVLFWISLGFVCLIQIIAGGFVIYSSQSTYGILLDAKEIYDQLLDKTRLLDQVDDDLMLQTYLASYSSLWIDQIPYFVDNIRHDPKALKDSLNDIFSVVTEDEDSIFQLEPKEHIKFLLYLYDSEKDELVPLWKQETTSGKKISGEKSRIWKPGEGHVGIAFRQGKSICTEDATVQNVLNVFKAPDGKLKAYDEELYKSFSSVTLFNNSNGGIGVLAATSNCKGRFDQDTYHLFVNLAASVVSSILHNQRINDIIASNNKV